MVATDRAGFTKFRIRDRRVVDVSNIDMSVNLFGTKWETPIFLCPCGSQNAYNPEGEIAVARELRVRKGTYKSYPAPPLHLSKMSSPHMVGAASGFNYMRPTSLT